MEKLFRKAAFTTHPDVFKNIFAMASNKGDARKFIFDSVYCDNRAVISSRETILSLK
jgi:hypothetical protein